MLRLLNEQLIKEGGASGHLMHLYDNRDLTFAELKELLAAAADGRLEKVTEKLDGMNLVFTWDGTLKVARSDGDIKGGGMDAAALAQKFHGRENVSDAFNGAFQVLNDAMSSLPAKVLQTVFKGGSVWYSIEVIYSRNPNVINYDSDYVVFHASPVFEVQPDGTVNKKDDAPGIELLEKHIERMQSALTQRSWQVRGPAVLRLKKFSDGSIVQNAISAIERAQNSAGVGDDATIGDYLTAVISEEVADLGLPEPAAKAVTARIVGLTGAPGLPQIKKMVTPDVYPNVKAFVDGQKALMKKAIEPLEHAVHNFAIEVLRGLHSVLVGNHDAEVSRLRQQVAAAVKAIQSSGDAKAMDVLATQMRKLGAVENIAAAMEGIVFIYKGNAYKFTGAFAPANQILGLFKYGRGGTKVEEQRELQDVIKVMLNNASDVLLERGREDTWEEEQKAVIRNLDNAIAKRDWVQKQLQNRANYEALLAQLLKKHKVKKKAEDEARLIQAQDPDRYKYDPNNSKQATLAKYENDLRKAMKAAVLAGLIDPRIPDEYYENDTEVLDDKEPAVLPKGKDKPILPVDEVLPFHFYRWKDNAWWKKIAKIKHGFTGRDSGKAEEKPEPGEARLAKILGGAQQGSGVGYDIVTLASDNKLHKVGDNKTKVIATVDSRGNQQRWEVKGVGGFTGSSSKEVRPAGKGMAAGDEQVKTLQDILQAIKNFLNVLDDFGKVNVKFPNFSKSARVHRLLLGNLTPEQMSVEQLKQLKEQYLAVVLANDYVASQAGWFAKGEISDERINMLYTVLKNLKEKVCIPWQVSGSEPKSLKIDDRDIILRRNDDWMALEDLVRDEAEYEYAEKLDAGTLEPNEDLSVFIDRKLNGPQGLMKVELPIARRLISRILGGKLFKDMQDIKALIQSVEKKLPIKEIFHGVDGVFLVTNAGFLLVPIDQVEDAFELNRYSMRRPFLKIKSEVMQLLEFNTKAV